MRLLVGRLTPAMRAKSVTPCGGRAGCRPAAAVHRFRYHLERATNVNSQRLPLPLRPGIAAQSPTGYLRLINGFRTLSSTSAADFLHKTCLSGPEIPKTVGTPAGPRT